jgi:hypothetical protein
VSDIKQTYNWRAVDVVGTPRWWIMTASTVDSTLTAGPEHLEAADAIMISSWRVTNVVGTSSGWRATDVMGVVGATPATSTLANSGMSAF